jgi:gamma-glutamylcyclotransferase (GGCT)/AIG2-like uncharacterized protein YtfP
MSPRTAQHRLAIYGTLAPGESNHDQVSMIRGDWRQGTVRGWLSAEGWGLTFGFPGLRLDPAGEVIKVQVLEAANLPDHWPRHDAFEGEEYLRFETCVETPNGRIDACVYVVKG